MSDRRLLVSPGDLDDAAVESILRTAHRWANRGAVAIAERSRVVGLLFLSSSLRTRAGFTAAAIRLGHQVVDVADSRWDPRMSAAESFDDTLRTLSGFVDAVCVRAPVELDAFA